MYDNMRMFMLVMRQATAATNALNNELVPHQLYKEIKMQLSKKWLEDYIDLSAHTPEEIADKLTGAGIPVENIIKGEESLSDKIVTGRLEKITPHENSDHLVVCQVNVGADEPLQIVTGAPNVKEGQIVPVALVGAKLPNGQKISKGKLRGVISMGMLCSAQELNLPIDDLPEEQTTGIYILPPDTPVGILAAKALNSESDVIFEFELTANRGDCFSVYGIVRELSALFKDKPAKFPVPQVIEDDDAAAAEMVKIAIEDEELCRRFSARVIKNVKIAPSPAWMQDRLAGAGIRAINNVVDVTNFVMIETGQPMHAYDYDAVKGHSLTARRAVAGERLHTLDDSDRLAKGTELVIADSEKAAGLGGVMGGLETEVTDNTQTIILEAANFNGANIRRTARSCGLATEASGRFERGIDIEGTINALNRACELLQKMNACTVTKGVVDVYPHPQQQRTVRFTPEEINARLGTDADPEDIVGVLMKLGFVTTYVGGGCETIVPSWRNDVTIMEDISEEFARCYGFDNIPATLPAGHIQQGRESREQVFADNVRDALAALGLNEELSFSFTNESMFDKMQVPADNILRQAIPVVNPLTDEQPLIRTSLLASILENTMRNFARKNEDVRLFEIAPVFLPKELPLTEQPREVTMLAGIITGNREPVGWTQSKNKVDFYDLKGIIEELLAKIAVEKYTVEIANEENCPLFYLLHPGKAAVIRKGRDTLISFGELHPTVAKNFDAGTTEMYVFEGELKTIMHYAGKKESFGELPKSPAVSRDLAIVVAKDLAVSDVQTAIVKAGGKYFASATLFDVYEGNQIASGKKSLAFALTFRATDKTLTDAEVDIAVNGIIDQLTNRFGAEIRS